MTANPIVIAPNFKKRLSGVTATVVRLVPIQSDLIDIAAVRIPADFAYGTRGATSK